MSRSSRSWVVVCMWVLASVLPAWAQNPAPSAATQAAALPSAGAPAAAEPRPEDTNAERAKSQPGNNSPMWRAVRESGTQPGITTLPGAEKGVLIQPFVQYPGSRLTSAGEAWRQVRNQWIIPYGGSLFLLMAVAIGMFYWRKGPMQGHTPDTGRLIERFTYLERVSHWAVAITFVILGVSGLVLAFGKYVLLPVLGGTLFGWLSYVLKTAHNFAGPLFSVALLVFIAFYVRDNLPKPGDLNWLSKVGGMFSGKELPSHRFNAGEKFVFWGGVIVLGMLVSVSGLVLNGLVPGIGVTRGEMQVAHMVHAIASVLMMTLFIGHIYMGSVGVKGAYQGMRTGYVDEAWAKDHHGYWHDDIKAGKIPAHRSGPPPAVLGSAAPQGH